MYPLCPFIQLSKVIAEDPSAVTCGTGLFDPILCGYSPPTDSVIGPLNSVHVKSSN
jgi:hypothetical protein